MKKNILLILTLVFAVAISAVGCNSGNKVEIKVGIMSTDTQLWQYIQQKAEKEGLKIELITFTDYVQPNLALADGSIDANAFQTISYLNQFKNERNLDIKAVGTTFIQPMGVYSKKYKDVKEIPNNATITIPNDSSNGGRALLLLEQAGLITLKEGFNGKGLTEAIQENPKNLKIVPVAAPQTPRTMDDVAAAVVNNDIAVQAGLNPTKDPIFSEDKTAKPYINVIAAQTNRANDPLIQKLVKIYQTDDVKQQIEKIYQGGTIPVFVPLQDIENL